MGKVNHLTARDMILCALFTALIGVGAYIKIPLPICPFTLQVMFTTLSGLLLGSRCGAISTGLYMLLGLIGIPVFTGGGGLGYIFQPTFGYIIGFIPGAWLAGKIVQRAQKKSFKLIFAAGLANLAVIYAIGVTYFYLITVYYLKSQLASSVLLMNCFLLVIPGDILSCAVDAILVKRLMLMIK